MTLRALPYLIIFLLMVPAAASAHGGGHGPQKESAGTPEDEAPAFQDSIYATQGGGESAPPGLEGDPLGSPLSRTDLLGGDDPMDGMGMAESGEPMVRTRERRHESGGPGEHEVSGQHTQHVELSAHEWVSPASRGYGVAVGITLVSGFVFAGLCFSRAGCKDSVKE